MGTLFSLPLGPFLVDKVETLCLYLAINECTDEASPEEVPGMRYFESDEVDTHKISLAAACEGG
jgi:hypothetical protein